MNNAHVQIECNDTKLFLSSGYAFGAKHNFGEKLFKYLLEKVAEGVGDEVNVQSLYHSVNDVVRWLQDNGGIYFQSYPENMGHYWYHIKIHPDNWGIEVRYVERDFHFQRNGDDDWLEEPDHALNKRLLTSDPVLVIGKQMPS
jgi:hypothetical protein